MSRSALSTELLRALYFTMRRIRVAENRIADLVDKKEIGCPCHLCVGQEAVAAGVCAALRREDYVFGGHRSHGHYLAKGGGLRGMMAEIFGKRTGCAAGRGGSMHLVAPEAGFLGTVPIVAATVPIAVGAALASQLRKDGLVAVSFFGDGAVEEGTTHEAMNLAAGRKLPVIFVCENNLYSSHLHLLERRAKDNIVESAAVHGMPGVRLDGNDVVAIYGAAAEAVTRARAGGGPTLLECRTYRWRGHVGSSFDLDVGVKRRGELAEWMEKDPIERLKRTLEAEGVPAAEFMELENKITDEVEDSVRFARESPLPDEKELGSFLFKTDAGIEAW